MATLRLFANLREAAGTSSIDLEGATVGDVLDAATARYGPGFAAGLAAANVWVNGEVANRSTAVAPDDEVAVIPPVSGGTTTFDEGDATPALLGLILLATFGIANVISLQALVFAVVGGALAWLWDVGDTLRERRKEAPVLGSLIAATFAANAAYAWGARGLAAALAFGFMVLLANALYDPRLRSLEAMGAGALMTMAASGGAGALVLVRLESAVLVTAFLVLVVLAAVATWAARRFVPDVGGLDPSLAAAVGVLIGAVAVGFVADTVSPAASLVAGAAAVAGLYAGRVVGSMLRSGDVAHTTRSPGLLTAVDGAVVAAAAFWIGMLIF